MGLLNDDALVLVGDLNCTFHPDEFWGRGKIHDPLSDYFLSLFDSTNLIDIIPSSLVPTWSNGRCGPGGVAK